MPVKYLAWNDPELFDQTCSQYFELVASKNEKRLEDGKKAYPPTLPGLKQHLKITESDYKMFKTKPGYEAYRDVLSFAEREIESWVTPRLMVGELNVAGTMTVMRNQHAWRDSSAEKTGLSINTVDSDIKIVVVNGSGERLNLPSGQLNLLPESDKPLTD